MWGCVAAAAAAVVVVAVAAAATTTTVQDVGESLCSLQFAIRARSVELGQARKHTGAAAGKSVGSAKR